MSRATILVVDDVPENLGLLLDALGMEGHRVLVAESGESAMAQLDHEVPDLILLDQRLPGMDGMEVCRRIRRRADCQDVPILFLTAVSDLAEKVRALDAGAVDYVTKPIESAEVLARVRTHLRISSLQRALQEEVAMRREAEEQLRDSLDRALVVAAWSGRIRFATRRAQTLLVQESEGAGSGLLPAPLVALLRGAGTGSRDGSSMEVRVLRVATETEPGVLELTAPDRATPAALLPLGLTPREAEVLFWVSEGKTNAEIGLILSSAKRTVEKHVEHILEKLGVENRAAAIREALRVRGNGG